MKRKAFDGVAVHPQVVRPGEAAMVGVWLRHDISSQQRDRILHIYESGLQGQVGVRNSEKGTAVICMVRLKDAREARARAASLARCVARILGACWILRQLPNQRAVSQALWV
jgi:hypothetical protein